MKWSFFDELGEKPLKEYWAELTDNGKVIILVVSLYIIISGIIVWLCKIPYYLVRELRRVARELMIKTIAWEYQNNEKIPK